MAKDKVPATVMNQFKTWCNNYVGDGSTFEAATEKGDKPRIPTGVFALDYMLGGGLPLWSFSCFWGPESGGKTSLSFNAVAGVQRTCFKCFKQKIHCQCEEPLTPAVVWINVEGDLDLNWAEQIGVDLNRLLVSVPSSAEQALTIAEMAIKIPDCGMVVIDSLAGLIPESELKEGSLYSQEPGAQARILSRFSRLIRRGLNKQKTDKHPVMVLATNQMRSKIGQMFGDPETMPSGWAIRHLVTVLVRISQNAVPSEKKSRYEIDGKMCVVRHVCKIRKNKIMHWTQACEFLRAIDYVDDLGLKPGQVHDLNTVLKFARDYGIITGSSGNYRIGKIKAKTYDEFKALWRERPDYYYLTQDLILRKRRELGINRRGLQSERQEVRNNGDS